MDEAEAKRLLDAMLDRLTPGSILHLLAEVIRERVAENTEPHDAVSDERVRETEAALFVFGIGLDAVLPR